MNQHDKDWTDDFLFRTKEEAVKYLEEQGYRLSNGWYRRKQVGWEGDTRALICSMKIYGE
jgi:hypothetical protein